MSEIQKTILSVYRWEIWCCHKIVNKVNIIFSTKKHHFRLPYKGRSTCDAHGSCLNFKTSPSPSPLSIYVQNFFTPFFHQVTSHSNWPCVLLFDLAHKQCNGIIKETLHYLKCELIGRFLVSNILMFDSAWDLVMAQIQFSLIKEMKIVRPDCTPYHPIPHITHTHIHTHPFPQSGRHMCITLNKMYKGICCCGDTYIGETIQNLE